MSLAKVAPTSRVEKLTIVFLEGPINEVGQVCTANIHFKELTISLLYLGMHTRPAIMFSKNILSRFMETPWKVH